MKRIMWCWFFLVAVWLIPWQRLEGAIEMIIGNAGPWIGGICVLLIIGVFIEITTRGLRRLPPPS